jgi:hypothetical protein
MINGVEYTTLGGTVWFTVKVLALPCEYEQRAWDTPLGSPETKTQTPYIRGRSLGVCTDAEVIYHAATLIVRVLLHQSAADWPALTARPWMATSITDFWSFRWHQTLRHTFTVLGRALAVSSSGGRAHCSARLACPPCCTTLVCGGLERGRNSAALAPPLFSWTSARR